MTAIVATGTETTGIHEGREVWEVAMIRREPDGTSETREFFIKVDLHNADPFGLNVGGFYDRHPDGQLLSGKSRLPAPPHGPDLLMPEDAANEIAAWTHGAHLVGVNPAFDAESLAKLLRRHFLIPAWNYHLIDVTAMALGYLRNEALHLDAWAGMGDHPDDIRQELRLQAADLRNLITPPYKSDELGKALGVPPLPPERRHTALGDAEWALAMYDAMTGTASR